MDKLYSYLERVFLRLFHAVCAAFSAAVDRKHDFQLSFWLGNERFENLISWHAQHLFGTFLVLWFSFYHWLRTTRLATLTLLRVLSPLPALAMATASTRLVRLGQHPILVMRWGTRVKTTEEKTGRCSEVRMLMPVIIWFLPFFACLWSLRSNGKKFLETPWKATNWGLVDTVENCTEEEIVLVKLILYLDGWWSF